MSSYFNNIFKGKYGQMTPAAEWIFSLAVSMPERWQAGKYGNPKYALPGSVIMDRPSELREELKTLKSEDLQLNLRPDLMPFFCCSRHDWDQWEFRRKNSQLMLDFDRKMKV